MEELTVRIFIEYAGAGRFLGSEFLHSVVVVHLALRQFLLRERNVKVVVEVTPVRRHPLEAPTHALLECFDLGPWRSRDHDQCHVPGIQMSHSAIDMIGHERAAWATMLPPWPEHKMINDQLATSVEEISE